MVFNRLDTTKRVFEVIRQTRPSKLYIAADGPRPDRENEAGETREVRDHVMHNIDWDCQVHTLFRDTNLGCKKAVSQALGWFFEHEEEGIILEDDCLPDPSFFPYCSAMLERYRHDERVMMISGDNFLPNVPVSDNSYFFSRYFPIWGWATWRRAWSLYDAEMSQWPQLREHGHLEGLYDQPYMRTYLRNLFNAHYGTSKTWDVQWFFTCLFNNGLCVIPEVNLISNIGIQGTSASGKTRNQELTTHHFDMESLRHPLMVFPNRKYDDAFMASNFKSTPTKKKSFIPVCLRFFSKGALSC